MWSEVYRPLSVVLLLTLSAGVGGGSGEDGGHQPATLAGSLDQLWAFIERLESSAGRSVLTRLDTRLEELHGRLAAQLGGLSDRLDGCQPSTELAARVAELYSRRDDCSRLETRLSGRLETLSARLDRLEQSQTVSEPSAAPRDCSDLPAGSRSGVYLLQPGLGAGTAPVPAYCDLDSDGGRWTVFQRRTDVKPREDFHRGWAAYKEGFGELDAEFWWGLENIWAMTSARDRQYELRIDLEDFESGERYAIFQNFRISSEPDGYRLSASNYTGTAGDSLKYHNGRPFSTWDKDQDSSSSNCAQKYTGGWWFNDCHHGNLNGKYLAGRHSSRADGINWLTWRGHHYSLRTTTMKTRPIKKA